MADALMLAETVTMKGHMCNADTIARSANGTRADANYERLQRLTSVPITLSTVTTKADESTGETSRGRFG